MLKTFSISHSNAVLNFSKQYCSDNVELLSSKGFKKVIDVHLAYLKRKDKPIYHTLHTIENDDKKLRRLLIRLFKQLLVVSTSDLVEESSELRKFIEHKGIMIDFVEGLYDYWRSLERYAIVINKRSQKGLQNAQFIKSQSDFESLVLETYRKISEELQGFENRVYRQLIAGVNAGIVLNEYRLDYCTGSYDKLRRIPLIESIVLHPPFITYPRRNTRDGLFNETNIDPLIDMQITEDDFLCYPAKVGKYFALIYFHKDFMAMGVTLANLFELADQKTARNTKPDMIYVYGVKDESAKTSFYYDKSTDIFVGYASYSEEFDYFGYMKKMILTLHNVKGIDQGGLPLHGAMAIITMEDNSNKNVVIIGDSGAGKSETLEALRALEDNGIKDIKIIFDDMGIIFNEDNKVLAYGTEIGAFVRLDDLDQGYAYKEIDRSIFMNPNKINARIVIPVANYSEIMAGYNIDLFLYANNYDEDGTLLDLIDDIDIAKSIFIDGARMAKGTTQEIGLVKSYFANPFGPIQRKEQTDILIDKYFNMLNESSTMIGQLKTKLGISGYESKGPQEAAIALLEYLNKM